MSQPIKNPTEDKLIGQIFGRKEKQETGPERERKLARKVIVDLIDREPFRDFCRQFSIPNPSEALRDASTLLLFISWLTMGETEYTRRITEITGNLCPMCEKQHLEVKELTNE